MILSINNHKFKTKTVFTTKHTQKGMMGKHFDKSFNGMLFLMDDSEHCFWMRDCLISLDIIFISNNKITKIHHDCSPCKSEKCKNYCGYGDMVLELKSGECKKKNIKVGDTLRF